MNHELKFDATVDNCVFAPKVGSDSEADNIFLFLSNDISLITTRLLPHMDSDNKGVPLIFSLLQTVAPKFGVSIAYSRRDTEQ